MNQYTGVINRTPSGYTITFPGVDIRNIEFNQVSQEDYDVFVGNGRLTVNVNVNGKGSITNHTPNIIDPLFANNSLSFTYISATPFPNDYNKRLSHYIVGFDASRITYANVTTSEASQAQGPQLNSPIFSPNYSLNHQGLNLPANYPLNQQLNYPPHTQLEQFRNMDTWSFWNWLLFLVVVLIVVYLVYIFYKKKSFDMDFDL